MSWAHAAQNQKQLYCKQGHTLTQQRNGRRVCAECKRVYMREWYAKRPEKRQANILQLRQWTKENPERHRATIDKWWKAHPEKKKAKEARRRERGYFKEYAARHREDNRTYQKEYYQKHKQRIRARQCKYVEANKESIKAYQKKWRTPDKQRLANHRRRARRLAASGLHTEAELKQLLDKQENRCANPYCKKDLAGFQKTIDHIVPLVAGGANDISNLQWLCRRCNASKGTKAMDEWLERQRAA